MSFFVKKNNDDNIDNTVISETEKDVVSNNNVKNTSQKTYKYKKKYKFTTEEKQEIMVFFIPVIICLICVLLVSVIGKSMLEPKQKKISEQNKQIAQLSTDIDLLNNEYKALQLQKTSQEQSYYYNGDNAKDDEIAKEFFAHFCTWEDSSMYETLRQELINEGYSSDSSLVRALLPKPVTYYDKESGNMLYEIDVNKYNMSFENIKSYPIFANSSKSEYSGIITVSTIDKSEDGMNKEYFGYVYVNYCIENNEMKNVYAEVLIEP